MQTATGTPQHMKIIFFHRQKNMIIIKSNITTESILRFTYV